MPTKPKIVTLTNSSVDILNVIRNNASQNYRDYVPKATADAESIREIGAIIMDYPALQNEFLSALVNRIGRVILSSKMYENPWSMFKKGMLEFGETIEDIFVNIAKPFQYDPEVAEKEVFKREIPDVRSAFYVMNFQKFYKSTIQQEQLRTAFLSWEGITDLISKIVDALYTGANYDEFQTMKYLLAKNIINGRIKAVNIPTVSTDNMKAIASEIKGTSNALTFLNTDNNVAGVSNASNKNEQYLILSTEFDAKMDIEVLASAFNMDKAKFAGHRVLVDGFGKLDIERLNLLFKDDPTYTEIGEDVLDALNQIPAILVDENWFMIFDNLNYFTEQYNSQGLYWNYFYHVWKTFAVSPFAQANMFIPTAQSVTSVTVTPTEATVNVGGSIQLYAKVETTGFAPQSVTWVSTSEHAEVDKQGKVFIKSTASSAEQIEIDAISTFDNTKKGTATLTVA